MNYILFFCEYFAHIVFNERYFDLLESQRCGVHFKNSYSSE